MARARILSCHVFLCVLVMAWAGCGGAVEVDTAGAGAGGGSSGMTTGGMPAGGAAGTGGSTGMSTGTSGGTECGKVPVLETDIVPIFIQSCGSKDNACHTRVAYKADSQNGCRGWLALEDEPLGSQFYGGFMDGQPTGCPDRTLYERLTELDAWQCGDVLERYVVPCDPDASYLWKKMGDGPYCEAPSGTPTEKMPIGKELDPAERELIRAWILAGTPRAGGDFVACCIQ
jgi:hypothetical protein